MLCANDIEEVHSPAGEDRSLRWMQVTRKLTVFVDLSTFASFASNFSLS